MVFREIVRVWSGDGLLNDALSDIDELFVKAKDIFLMSIDDLVENESSREKKIDLLEEEIDKRTREVRRKIVEYLAVNQNPNISASLVLAQIVTDLERIGDISKDILSLDRLYNHTLTNSSFSENVLNLRKEVSDQFDNTKNSFKNSDSSLAEVVLNKNNDVRKICDEMFTRLWNGEGSNCQEEIIYVLTFRYIRRVSEHLKNVATSVIKPYHDIGHSK